MFVLYVVGELFRKERDIGVKMKKGEKKKREKERRRRYSAGQKRYAGIGISVRTDGNDGCMSAHA